MASKAKERAKAQARVDAVCEQVAALEAEFEQSFEGWEAYDEYVASWGESSAFERAFEKWCDDNDKWDVV